MFGNSGILRDSIVEVDCINVIREKIKMNELRWNLLLQTARVSQIIIVLLDVGDTESISFTERLSFLITVKKRRLKTAHAV